MPLGAASGHYAAGVEILNRSRGPPAYRIEPNSEYRRDYPGSESTRANLRGRKGNSPDHRLRSLIHAKCLRKSFFRDSGDVGLEAAII